VLPQLRELKIMARVKLDVLVLPVELPARQVHEYGFNVVVADRHHEADGTRE
jgi:hypothetical protein